MDLEKLGYRIGLIAIITVLLWIGALKFTPGEADAIKNYVSHSFLMNWMYGIFSTQGVSILIGVYEIIAGILLIMSFWSQKIGLIAGIMTLVIFATTLSFLITTPGVWKISEGVPVTDFFVVKDIAFLAISILVIAKSKSVDIIVSA